MGDLTGMGALVTGGSSGIGLACAKRLAQDGADVALMARGKERLAAAVAEMQQTSRGRISWVEGDATDPDSVAAAVSSADQNGSLRIVVASAGLCGAAPLLSTSSKDWNRIIEINLTSVFYTLKASIPHLRRNGGGAFTAISSISGYVPATVGVAYQCAKAGVNALAKAAANELGEKMGIRVNSVCPGLTRTPAQQSLIEIEFAHAEILAHMPLPKIQEPGEIAEVVRFLSGPESSRLTGLCLPVDGGMHLRGMPDLRSLFEVDENQI